MLLSKTHRDLGPVGQGVDQDINLADVAAHAGCHLAHCPFLVPGVALVAGDLCNAGGGRVLCGCEGGYVCQGVRGGVEGWLGGAGGKGAPGPVAACLSGAAGVASSEQLRRWLVWAGGHAARQAVAAPPADGWLALSR